MLVWFRWDYNHNRWNGKDATVGTVDKDTEWWRSSLPSTDHFSLDSVGNTRMNTPLVTSGHAHPWTGSSGCGASGCADPHCVHRKHEDTVPSTPMICVEKIDNNLQQSSHNRAGGGANLAMVYRKRRGAHGLDAPQRVLLSTRSREILAEQTFERLSSASSNAQ